MALLFLYLTGFIKTFKLTDIMIMSFKGNYFPGLVILLLQALLFTELNVASDTGNRPDTEAAELLSAYVQIPSVSGQEKEAGVFLESFCRENGLYTRIFTDQEDSFNFAASLYPLDQQKPNIVFLTHIDVVPAGDEQGWTYPPFSGKIADGMVWGRGAIDNKALGVMQLMAILRYKDLAHETDLPYNVSLLAVSGEETGGNKGARIIASEYLEELNPVVVYGEGGAGVNGLLPSRPDLTVFGIEVVQKRRMFLEVISDATTSGHGSIPREVYSTREVTAACNALIEAIPNISVSPTVSETFIHLSDYESGLVRRMMKNVDFFAPLFGRFIRRDPISSSMLTNTMVLTSISSAEGAYNQIPTHTRAVFDCRLLPDTDEEEFLEEVKRIVSPWEVSVNVLASSPPAPVSEQGMYFRALKESLYSVFGEVEVVPFLFVAINDNRFFRRRGIPSYGLLPAIMPEELMESIHYFDERFPVGGLNKGIEVYVNLIYNILNQTNEF